MKTIRTTAIRTEKIRSRNQETALHKTRPHRRRVRFDLRRAAPAQALGYRSPASLICYVIIDGLTAGSVADSGRADVILPSHGTGAARKRRGSIPDGPLPLLELQLPDFANDTRAFGERIPLRDPPEK